MKRLVEPKVYGVEITRLHKIFRSQWYLSSYPDIAVTNLTPFEHFIEFGLAAGRSPNILFHNDLYRANTSVPSEVPAIIHYLNQSSTTSVDPYPLFSTTWYLDQVGTLPHGLTPLEHYFEHGWKDGIDPHPLFSNAWYMKDQKLSELNGITPLEHYLTIGWRNGVAPCSLFLPNTYLNLNQDIADSVEPLTHYVAYGGIGQDNRQASPFIDNKLYLAQCRDDSFLKRFGHIAHYLHFGSASELRPSDELLANAIARHLSSRQQKVARDYPGRSASTYFPEESAFPRRASALKVPQSTTPVVSIVIPTFNHSEDVVLCLETIAAAGETTPFEVILVDDASSPEHAAIFRSISGIKLCRLETNKGFSGATTAGVALGQGEYLLLLNNDTEVLPGFLDALVARAESDTEIGVVGSMIIRPDQFLQEAGCVVFADGSARQLGAGQNPCDWKYRTAREVDYCSGASLLIRRSVWDKIGGFDERFSPAYYEDVDIAFEARRLGFKVLYEPRSVLFHNEGTTHGKAFTGVKRFQLRNQDLFVSKWRNELGSARPTGENWSPIDELKYRDRRKDRGVLIIDHRLPNPTEDAGSVRMIRLIEILASLGYVVHLHPIDGKRTQPATSRFEQLGAEVIGVPLQDAQLRNVFSALADSLDLVIVSRPEVVSQVSNLLSDCLPMVPMAFDMVDAHRKFAEAKLTGDEKDLNEAERLRRVERMAARVADVVITVSDADDERISEIADIKLKTVRIPTIHIPADTGPDFAARNGILFVGGYEHPPNVDAARYFIKDILPLIEAEIGPVHVTLAGSKPTDEILQLRSSRISVPGWLESLTGLYHEARVVVAPLRFGAGVKGKIGEALTFGVPTVTTPIGIDGMPLVAGHDILVGASPAEFASQVLKLYQDPALWKSIRNSGINTIDQEFGASFARKQVAALFAVLK